jgi:hypothetical protein
VCIGTVLVIPPGGVGLELSFYDRYLGSWGQIRFIGARNVVEVDPDEMVAVA